MVMVTTKETKHIILHTRNLKRKLTTNDFCDDYTSMLGVYTNVLFAEDRGLSRCIVRERNKQCNGDCILSNNCFITESINGCMDMSQSVTVAWSIKTLSC